MARNRVQFQKGYSLTQFMDEHGTEEKCTQALFRWRWPNGFVCPRCEHTGHWRHQSRELLPHLNNIYCYFTYQGDWRTMSSDDATDAKRTSDRVVFPTSSFGQRSFWKLTKNIHELHSWSIAAKDANFCFERVSSVIVKTPNGKTRGTTDLYPTVNVSGVRLLLRRTIIWSRLPRAT